MPNKKFSALLLMVSGVFLVASMLLLWPATRAFCSMRFSGFVLQELS